MENNLKSSVSKSHQVRIYFQTPDTTSSPPTVSQKLHVLNWDSQLQNIKFVLEVSVLIHKSILSYDPPICCILTSTQGQEVYSTNSDDITQDVEIMCVLVFVQESQSTCRCCFLLRVSNSCYVLMYNIYL